MSYFSELRANWRPLFAALIGFGSGLSFVTTTTSIMAPRLIEAFGWTRAEIAAVGSSVIVLVLTIPFIGRITDMIGVRATALIGIIAMPIILLTLSAMTGDIGVYISCILAMKIICGTTTATVYSRIVVQYVEKARGLALALVASGPAISVAVIGPMLNSFVAVEGWRAGYVALALFSASAGVIALLLMPSERKTAVAAAPVRRAREDYAAIAKTGAFWVLVAAMLLCNLPQMIALLNLNLVMEDNGVATADVGVMISAFAIGQLAGRFLCGLALDRFPTAIVSAISMGLPGIGLLLLASNMDTPIILTLAVFLIGLSYGAESDLLGYLVVRLFGVRIYSTVLGLVTASISLSIAGGAILISLSLAYFDSYTPFLIGSAIAVFFGAFLLLWLRPPPADAVDAKQSALHP
jgi:MFS family permease